MSAGSTRPSRQDSVASAASSAADSVRPPSSAGRSKASAATAGAASFLARWTGKGKASPEEPLNDGPEQEGVIDPGFDVSEAGPSDYWRRSPSPSVSNAQDNWRQHSDQPMPDDPWSGGSNVTDRDLRHDDGYFGTPHAVRRGWDSPTLDSDDGAEYNKRLKAVALDQAQRPGTIQHEEDVSSENGFNSGFATPRKPPDIADAPNGDTAVDLAFPQRAESDGTPSTPALSVLSGKQSADPSPLRRNPYLHPSVSRLRSHMRTSSTATDMSAVPAPRPAVRMASHFSQLSLARSASMSSVVASPVLDQSANPAPKPPTEPAFIFRPLRQLSTHLFAKSLRDGSMSPLRPNAPRKGSSLLNLGAGTGLAGDESANISLGRPTVMDVHGMIAVGTANGWTAVYTFAQELRCILGNPTIIAASGPVTCVKISRDSTYVGVGHASGNIHLYDLSSPAKPARSTVALSLKQVLSGRKEGHLQGSKISHLDFVGARHTAIVSGDEHGRAFWWSLGKVVGVESNDVVRMLGSYTNREPVTDGSIDGENAPAPARAKRATTLLATTALPITEPAGGLDETQIIALLTQTKLVVVGLRPTAKTLYRRLRQATGGSTGGRLGCAAWRPRETDPQSGACLAYSWGGALRMLNVSPSPPQGTAPGDIAPPAFRDGARWDSIDPIHAIRWYDLKLLLLLTTRGILLFDTTKSAVVEATPIQISRLTTPHTGPTDPDKDDDVRTDVQRSFTVYRENAFLLTRQNLQVGTLQHWNDKILARVHSGDFLGAIRLAVAFYEDKAEGNQQGLPVALSDRKSVTGNRARELMRASLSWAFSEDRMHDDTHYSVDGRGVDLTGLFEGLASVCVEACLVMADTSFLFDVVYEHFAQAGIHGLFLDIFEPAIFDRQVRDLPPAAVKALIEKHEDRGELDLAEGIVWNVNPLSLDLDQAVRLCESHHLWDALIYVLTQAMHDYVAPIVKLIAIIRQIQQFRDLRSANGDADAMHAAEASAPEAYKLFGYLDAVLSGETYPRGERIASDEANRVREEVYGFIFSGRVAMWPSGSEGELVLASENANRSYPYLHLLLRFDTEAFLHTMDVAFEDSWLDDPHSSINRQTIVNLMLDVMDTDDFTQYDITFLNIFVARNLAKYQYTKTIFVPTSRQESILRSLAEDPDQSTREDRQLAAEYLLSAYTPRDWPHFLTIFEHAGFFRICRDQFRRQGDFSLLVRAHLRDPDAGIEVFTALDEILLDSRVRDDKAVSQAILDHISQLLDLSIAQTAILLDRRLSNLHDDALEQLSGSDHKQLAYLRCLFEPDEDNESTGPLAASAKRSPNVTAAMKQTYIELLGRIDLEHLLQFLDEQGSQKSDLGVLADDTEGRYPIEVQLWALDRGGRTEKAFDAITRSVRRGGIDIAQSVLSNDEGAVHMAFVNINSVTRMALRFCQEHTKKGDGLAEDLWFEALHTSMELIHGLSSLATRGSAEKEAENELIVAAQENARTLVRATLQALIASSSASLSYPRLFRRLIDASASSMNSGRAYAEFRSVLGSMLDSYRMERDVLVMTTHLIGADVFDVAQELSRKQQQGWRAATGQCSECSTSLQVTGTPASAGGQGIEVMILASGSTVHKHCRS